MTENLVEFIIWMVAIVALTILGSVIIYFENKRRREEEAEVPQRVGAGAGAQSPETVEMAAWVAMSLLDYVSFRRQDDVCGSGECAVCIGEMEDGELCCALPMCGHEFHRECMEKWFMNNKSTCPMCRAQVQLPCVLQRLPVADMV